MTDFNKKVIFNSFFKGQFNCSPLLWMFSTREVNHKINRFHERGLKALLHDETSTFNDMLLKSNNNTDDNKFEKPGTLFIVSKVP